MKSNKSKKGFTLIELLVVVLIIGILAAIALPQYKQAVFNSKMKKVEVLMSNLSSALQEYQLIHGKGTVPSGLSDFGWQPPEGCVDETASYSWIVVWRCQQDVLVGLKTNTLVRNGTVSASLRIQGGSGGSYSRFVNGSFECYTTSLDSAASFKKYCEINNIPITS